MKAIVLLLFVLGFIAYSYADCGTMCTNWIEDGNNLFTNKAYGTWGTAYVRDSSSTPIQTLHDASITSAVIVIHGNQRDANAYFCYISQAVATGSMSASTYIVAPHFMMLEDNPSSVSPNAFYWATSAGWKEGGRSSTDTSRISSFQILDDMVKAFYNKDYFPGMQQVVVVGHSAGGQTVQRYAISTGIDANYTVRYVVENPGSYAYLDDTRAILPNLTLPTCTACVADEILKTQYTFGPVSRAGEQDCTDFNDWKMGLETGNVWLKLRTSAVIRAQYKLKNIQYLLGTNDTCNTALGSCGCSDNSLDTDCSAEMQGYCRLQRGVIFYQYLQQYYKADALNPVHTLSFVSDLGHDGCAMLNSEASIKAMFPNAVIVKPTPAPSIAPSASPSPSPSNSPSTIAPTSAPSSSPVAVVNATITVTATVSIADINAVDTIALEKAFATALGVSADSVTVTFTPITQKKRATNYKMTVTITQPVAAGTSDVSLSENTTAALKQAIANPNSSLGQALASSGATVDTTSLTTQTSVPTTQTSTTGNSGAVSLISSFSLVVSLSLFLCVLL